MTRTAGASVDPGYDTIDIDACAAQVARADPDRFAAAMTAPVAARPGLFVLYAFNLEVARAPWVTSEAMLAEMRVQWWVDALAEIWAGAPPRRHEVVTPLAALIRARALPRAPFDALIEARRADIARIPPPDLAAVGTYLDATSGGLAALAGAALGADPAGQAAARLAGQAAGAANLLRAVPELLAAGVDPLPGGEVVRAAAVRDLANWGLDALARGRGARRDLGPARPAALVAWMAAPVLARAAADPAAAIDGRLEMSEFQRRGRLLIASQTGRF